MQTYIIKSDEDLVDVCGYEGKYRVNNLGEVISVDREKWQGNGWQKIKGRKLKPVNQNGYLAVNLCLNGKQKTISIHRLVANAFIENIDNVAQVNHKDGNKHNNLVENLEWVSAKDNQKHSIRNLGNKKPPVPRKADCTYKFCPNCGTKL